MPKDQKQSDFYWLLDTLDAHMSSQALITHRSDSTGIIVLLFIIHHVTDIWIIDDRVRRWRLDGHQGFIFSWVED